MEHSPLSTEVGTRMH